MEKGCKLWVDPRTYYWTVTFVSRGVKFSADDNPLTDAKARMISQSVETAGKMRHIWYSKSIPLKLWGSTSQEFTHNWLMGRKPNVCMNKWPVYWTVSTTKQQNVKSIEEKTWHHTFHLMRWIRFSRTQWLIHIHPVNVWFPHHGTVCLRTHSPCS